MLWLNLTSTYGSISHKLVEMTLDCHHIPNKIKDLILNYYKNSRLSHSVTLGNLTSEWNRLEKRIITGCTISVILFALVMNMVVKTAEVEWSLRLELWMTDGSLSPHHQCQEASGFFRAWKKLYPWQLGFKLNEFRSMVLKRGKVVDKPRFQVTGFIIPSITERYIRCLGKVFDCSLRDATATQATIKELESWLTTVERSGLSGRYKAWLYQHGILP